MISRAVHTFLLENGLRNPVPKEGGSSWGGGGARVLEDNRNGIVH